MLTGNTLIETITKNSTIDEKTLIKSCGYATVTKSGKEKIQKMVLLIVADKEKKPRFIIKMF